MAYFPRYEAIFSNELQQEVAIQILRKDVEEDVESFTCDALNISDSTDENTIIARELTIGIFADNASFTWETLLSDSFDEWMVVVTVDGMHFFRGFLTPEEGESPLLDQPYDVVIRATNGIKLLKDVPLSDLDGELFHGKFTLVEYLTAALQKALLQSGGDPLPIRIYGSWYNQDMQDRLDDVAATYWNQVKHDHRTYQESATAPVNCYEALLILLERHSRIFYWNDKWVVFLIPEHQYRPSGLFYSDFDGNGVILGGAEDIEGVATVGETEAIYPIDEAQLRSTSFPIKFAKTQFNYEPWEEMPLNNKFERGTVFETGIALDDMDDDNDGDTTEIIGTYTKKTIDDWTAGMVDLFAGAPFTLGPTEGDTYIRSVFNPYGVELRREVFMETPTTVSVDGSFVKWLQAEPLPVNLGDKIRISIQLRYDNDFTGSGDGFAIIGRVILIPDTGTIPFYALDNNIAGQETSTGRWVADAVPNFISIDLPEDSNSKKYHSISIESDALPVNGTLYINLQHSNNGSNPGGNKWFTGFELEYLPFVVNGYVPVEGDYWQHTSDSNQLDADNEGIRISDTIIRVLKGCFFNVDGVTATNPNWYRQGVDESRHFKELVNLGRYNLGYRRFHRIEGPFTGLLYSPVDDQLNMQPIGYHKEYRFLDLEQPKDFILVPPLKMDLCTGNIDASFEEVLNPALTTNYGTNIYRVIGRIISLFNDYWGGAATLERLPSDPRMMRLISGAGDVVSAFASDGGAGNAPSLIVNTQFDDGALHIALLTIGSDIAFGNLFEVNLNGDGVGYTVVDIIEQSDGTQLSDRAEFKYVFSNRR